jgi:hypothetical protein
MDGTSICSSKTAASDAAGHSRHERDRHSSDDECGIHFFLRAAFLDLSWLVDRLGYSIYGRR